MSISLEREEPPEPTRSGMRTIPEMLEAAGVPVTLCKNAGKWYRVLKYSQKGTAYDVASRLRKDMSKFEWVARENKVYGRYADAKDG